MQSMKNSVMMAAARSSVASAYICRCASSQGGVKSLFGRGRKLVNLRQSRTMPKHMFRVNFKSRKPYELLLTTYRCPNNILYYEMYEAWNCIVSHVHSGAIVNNDVEELTLIFQRIMENRLKNSRKKTMLVLNYATKVTKLWITKPSLSIVASTLAESLLKYPPVELSRYLSSINNHLSHYSSALFMALRKEIMLEERHV